MMKIIKSMFLLVVVLATFTKASAQADLKLEAVLSPDTTLITATDELLIRYELLNTGTTNATGVQVKVTIPASFSIVSSNPIAGTTFTPGTGIWNIGTLATSASDPNPKVLLIVVKKPVAGIASIEAEVSQMTGGGPDPDSSPNNGANLEDDYQSFCISTPYEIAPPQTLTISVAPGTTGIQWYKDASPINGATGTSYVASQEGIYTFTSSLGGCPNGKCCPVKLTYLPSGSIGDLIWKDANDNGIQDLPTEKGVKGVIVQLLKASDNSVLATDTTDTNGNYNFPYLTSDSYKVKIVTTSLPDTCKISPKQDAGTPNDDTKDSDFDHTTGISPVIVIDAAGSGIAKDNPTIDGALYVPCIKPNAGSNFSICQLETINLIDASASEKWVALSGPSLVSIDSTTGVVSGGLAVGDYEFALIYKLGGSGCADTVKVTVNSKPDAGTNIVGGLAICNTVATVDLPNAANGEIWTQLGSTPKAVTITTTTGIVTGMDAIGTYQFILKNATTNCVDTVSVEVKNCAKGSIGDFVWKDANDNGIQDFPTEKGVKGVIVQLLNATNNAVLATDTTNSLGQYDFLGLDSGSYKVKIVLSSLPDTCQISPKQDAGTPNDDTNDSDFNSASGESPVIVINTLGTGIAKDNPTIDAALFVPCVKPAAGADVAVCLDITTVNLKDAGVGEVWSKGTQPASTSASINASTGVVTGLSSVGDYFFILTYKGQALCSDTVKVTVNSKPNAGADITGGAAICNTVATVNLPDAANGESWSQLGSAPKAVTINAATGVVTGMDVIGTYQFILKNPTTGCADTVAVETRNCLKGTIGDFVWKDANDNGIQDFPTEKGVKGVIVQLLNATNNAVLATDTTNSLGQYDFLGLDTGTYKVKIVLSSLPDTCKISSKQDVATGGGNDTNDSDFNPTTGESQVITINTLGTGIQKDNPTIDAAVVVPCSKPTFTLTSAPICSADVQTYSISFSVTGKNGIIKVDKGTLTGSNPYTVSGVPSGATLRIVDSLSAVCKYDTLVVGPNCNCNPPLPILIAPSLTACIGDTFPTIKAMVVGLATVEWFTSASGGTPVFTGLNYKPSGTVTALGDTLYAQARSTDASCPTAISTSRVAATINAQNCTKIIDLALKKSINTKIAQIGDVVTFTIKVWNESQVAASGVEVTDSIATTVQFQTGTFAASRGSATLTGSVIKWNIGNIAANGDTVTLSYQVKATQQGLHYNTAEISKTNEKDSDSTPGNGIDGEDDIDRQCFTVPIKVCATNKVEVSVPANLTGVQWFKNGGATPVATGNVVLLSEVGSYTYTATNNTCPTSGCCPIILVAGDNCCPADACIPFTVKKIKK